MRFRNAETERFFVEIHADMLARNVFKGGLACAGASVIVMASLIARALPNVRDDATWRLNFATAAACLGISIVLAAAAKMKRFLRLLGPQTREVGVMTLVLMLAAVQFALDPWYGAKILRREPQPFECHQGNFSDTRPVLVLSILVLASHLALPIRWVCLFPLEMAIVLLYAGFAFLLGGPDGKEAWSTLLLILGLVICAAIGRRTIEEHQRSTFSTVISERNLRAESEFQLEQGHGSRFHHVSKVFASESQSRPDTTSSCLAFESHKEGQNLPCLDRLLDLGHREQWYVNISEIKVLPKFLGEGGYGVVLAGEYYGSPVALKVNKLELLDENRHSNQDRLTSSLNEIRILRRLRHPNIVVLYGACLDEGHDNIAMVLESVSGESLQELVLGGNRKPEELPPRDRLRAVVQVSRALRYLHSRVPPVVHGDLKASNIMAEQVPGAGAFHRMKLLDFGLARALTKHALPLGGTLIWMAPELVASPGQPPQVAADTFSFGRMAFFVFTGITPLAGKTRREIIDLMDHWDLPPMPWPPGLDASLAACREIIERCVEFRAEARPSMETVGCFLEGRAEDPSGEAPGRRRDPRRTASGSASSLSLSAASAFASGAAPGMPGAAPAIPGALEGGAQSGGGHHFPVLPGDHSQSAPPFAGG